YVGPLTFLMARSWIGAAFLIPVIMVRDRFLLSHTGENEKPRNKTQLKTLLAGGAVTGTALFLAALSQQVGISGTTTAKAGFITAQYVVIVPILSVFFGKKVGKKIWGCVMLAVVGLYFLCMTGSFSLNRADALMLLCAFLFGVQIMAVNYYSPRVDTVRLSCLQFLVEAVLSTIFMLFLEPFDAAAFRLALFSILYAGVMSSGVAFTLQIVAQKKLDPTVASIAMSLESVFSALAGWIILHQTLTPLELCGCALMFAAIVLSQI
ncbi:MAG: DMT family transporter, partial [Lachnospiraceae bacterium]|nr:DMT family transporter [Lachnospiraceae bacterium]